MTTPTADPKTEPLAIFVGCLPGLESMLLQEVRALELAGVTNPPATTPGGLSLDADLRALYRLNLELGLAQSVRIRVATFRATKLPELVRKAARTPWERYLPKGAAVRLRASAKRSRLYHTGAITERVLRAMSERLGRPVRTEESAESLRIHVRVVDDLVQISLDTTGTPLHQRGYRLETAKAPLREDLARALVWASGWDRTHDLVDPMMGAGTIVIEAAMLARRIPPGHARGFMFESLPFHDEALWQRVRTQALDRVLPEIQAFRTLGSDRDAGAWKAAVNNAKRAGVDGDLHLACAPISAAPFLEDDLSERGTIVTNPPWGARVSEGKDLRPLYQRLGTLVKDLPPHWGFAMVTADAKLAKQTKLPLESLLLTDAGGIKVQFFRKQ